MQTTIILLEKGQTIFVKDLGKGQQRFFVVLEGEIVNLTTQIANRLNGTTIPGGIVKMLIDRPFIMWYSCTKFM